MKHRKPLPVAALPQRSSSELVTAFIERAIERGVNLVHVSTGYLGGKSIQMLGNVLKTRRDQVYVALKDNFDNLDDVLRTLNTDHVDFIMFNRHSEDSARDPRIREQFEKLSANLARAAITAQGAIAEAALRQADAPLEAF